MRYSVALVRFALLVLCVWSASIAGAQDVIISEIRIDQPSTDNDEYFELAGAAGTSLDGLTYLVIGDGTGGSGVIDAVVDLTGQTVPASGFFVAAESTFTLGAADLTTSLNFENSDNVTHLLVASFTGAAGDDLDTDDDGVLDVTPWAGIVDLIALIEEENPPSGTEYHYGPPTVGPDGPYVPGHAFTCPAGWQVGAFDPAEGDDTPGAENICLPEVFLSEIRIDQPSTDYDEYFELAAAPGTPLDRLTYLVIGDGAGGSGVIEAIVDLGAQTVPAGGFFVAAESTFSLGSADMVTSLDFENSDNVTHLLVADFVGSDGEDLDFDDDGVLDVVPWSALLDCVALVETPGSGDLIYCSETVGPDGPYVPGHVFNCADGWEIGQFNPVGGHDTPGAANACATPPPDVTLSEIRIDQPSTDYDEYFELAGAPGTSLDGVTYLVIGDGTGGSGVIDAVVDLTGQTVPASGYFVAAEGTFSLGAADLVTSLNFENSDNVTHLLVTDFTGAYGDDLDADDDGVLDVTPWAVIVDLVALIEEENPPSGTEYHYGPPTVGPDGSYVPGHAFDCPGGWEIGRFDPVGGHDTPGAANPCVTPPPDVALSEIRIDQPSADNDEYFELAAAAGTSLDGLTYLVIGDGATLSGTVEAVVDLSGQAVPAGGFFVAAEGTFTLGLADLTTSLNFENSDNVTHLLVADFTGAYGDDLDFDDDGVLDVEPWSAVVDCIGLVETPSSGEHIYCSETVGPDGSYVPGHAFDCPEGWEIGQFDPSGGNDTPGAENSCPAPPVTLMIHDIQGSGALSPYDGVTVQTTDNIVTAVQANGFFMQTPDALIDADPLTSEGIFVFASSPVAVGDQVDVIGIVAEFFDLTEISGPVTVTVDTTGNPMPSAGIIDSTLPSDFPADPAELERFEGMRVVTAGMATGPSNRFGDVAVVARTVRSFREPGIEWPGLASPPGLPVWDGNPEIFELDPDGLGLPDVLMYTGQEFAAEGVLGFAFGSYQVLPDTLTVGPVPDVLRPVRDRAVGEFTVASQNLYFLVVSDPDLTLRIEKLSWHIREVLGAPDILAVQEVDTIDTLQMVADQIVADDPAIFYTPYLLQGQAWSDIEIGYLVRDTVVVNSLTQYGFDETFDCDGDEWTTYDRPPLVLDAEYVGAGEPFPITVIANHLRSLSGIEDNPCVRAKRHQQALRLSEFIQTLQGADPGIRLVVTGDFNAFQFTDGYVDVTGQITGNLDPLGALIPGSDEVDPDLTNEIFLIPGAERYSYIYMGNAQGFDHVLTSASLDPWVSGTEYSRGNADAPAALLPDWSTPMRVSDHDGVVLFLFNDADLDGVPNDLDMCPGTVIPEAVPTQRLGTNRWALVDDDGVFDTSPPRGGGGGPALFFTIDDTAGCSCEQIIDELDLGQGHEKFGCPSGAMEDWIFSLP